MNLWAFVTTMGWMCWPTQIWRDMQPWLPWRMSTRLEGKWSGLVLRWSSGTNGCGLTSTPLNGDWFQLPKWLFWWRNIAFQALEWSRGPSSTLGIGRTKWWGLCSVRFSSSMAMEQCQMRHICSGYLWIQHDQMSKPRHQCRFFHSRNLRQVCF